MTAAREPVARTLNRTVWVLHRAAFRFTGGRFGLVQPEARDRFDSMRLSTVGRRSSWETLSRH
jgi:hypothetical protein